jgi:MFS family permease
MFLLTASEMFSMPFMNTFAMQQAPSGSTGSYMALYTMSWSMAMMLAPLLGSQAITHWGYNGLWASVSGTLLLCLIVFFYLGRKFKGEGPR